MVGNFSNHTRIKFKELGNFYFRNFSFLLASLKSLGIYEEGTWVCTFLGICERNVYKMLTIFILYTA